MIDIRGKRLLVLGGGYASYNVVKVARDEGVYVVVADYYKTGEAKDIANKAVNISSVDMDALLALIIHERIDGVFCGASEFQLLNVMKLCEMAGLPFYCTREQWDICQNKISFKNLCRQFSIPVIPDYHVTEEFLEADLVKIEYPVVVKPADASASRGLSYCENHDELKAAYKHALQFSNAKQVLVEKFIKSKMAVAARYLAYDGNMRLYIVNTRHLVVNKGEVVPFGHLLVFPSHKTESYLKDMDQKATEMFKSIGMRNGSFCIQGMIDEVDGTCYYMEASLRLNALNTYKVTEPVLGINDLKMMIRYALGAPFSDDEEMESLDVFLRGKTGCVLAVPLREGHIQGTTGMDEIEATYPNVKMTRYYTSGGEVNSNKLRTLDSIYGRLDFVCDTMEDAIETINFISKKLRVLDENGDDMVLCHFNTDRLREDV